MNRAELIRAASEKSGIAMYRLDLALDALSAAVLDALAAGEPVKLVGFGTFRIKDRAPRTGRNPRTNAAVRIPPRRLPVFEPGAEMRSAVVKMAGPSDHRAANQLEEQYDSIAAP